MTRTNLIKKLAEETNLTKEQVSSVLKAEEEQIMYAIATNDYIQFRWGKIGGMQRNPMKAAGKFALLDAIMKNHGWTYWKTGVPYIKWTKEAKDCEQRSPELYFNLPEHKFTTQAYLYRKDAKLPELPEYSNLTEPEILKLCEEADITELSHLPRVEAHEKLYRQEYRKRIAAERSVGWAASGFVPTASLNLTEEDYEKYGLKKPELVYQDKVGYWLKNLKKGIDASYNWKYSVVQYLKMLAVKLNIHQYDDELISLESEYYTKLIELKQPVPIFNEVDFEAFEKTEMSHIRYTEELDPYLLKTAVDKQERLEKQAEDLLSFQEKLQLQNDVESFEE